MRREPGDGGLARARSGALAMLAISGAVALLVLWRRNLFDDELLSLDLLLRPLREIVAIANEGDVHPPGMYLLGHAAWLATGSFRWLNVFPLAVFYAGLAGFVLRVAPLFREWRVRAGFLLLCGLHPELLLWTGTFRWYSWWTGIALWALVLALEPGRERAELTSRRAVGLGVLLAAIFYLNYIAALFALALAAAMAVRWRARGWRRFAARLGTAVAVAAVLVVPQLHAMVTVHLANGQAQRSGVAASVLRLVEGLTASEAFVPWNVVGLVGGVVVAVLLVAGVAGVLRQGARESEEDAPGLRALSVFAVAFFALVALAGLGDRPRNALVLIPALAPAGAWALGRVGRRVQSVVLVVLTVWVGVGTEHMLARSGLLKTGMNDRPGEVARLVAGTRPERGCAVVATYDAGVAFRLAQDAEFRGVLLSPFRGPVFNKAGAPVRPECARPELFLVESYVSGEPGATYATEVQAAQRFFAEVPRVARLSADPEAARKRRFAGLLRLEPGDSLPDFRFTVQYGPMDAARYGELVATMPYFRSVQPESSGGGLVR